MNDKISSLVEKAKRGDTQAQLELADNYLDGEFVEQNKEEAMKWYTEAAKRGDCQAQLELAGIYEDREDTVENIKLSLYWYKKASDSGFAPAQYSLASLYEEGKIVTKDISHAIDLYKSAGSKDNIDSINRLAKIYEDGIGVDANINIAIVYFKKSSDLGDVFGKAKLIEYKNKAGLCEADVRIMEGQIQEYLKKNGGSINSIKFGVYIGYALILVFAVVTVVFLMFWFFP
jgi:TPR repeat protein